MEAAEFDKIIATNLSALQYQLYAFHDLLRASDAGRLIAVSSGAALHPRSYWSPYGAAKAAVNSLTSTLSVELAPKIRVNAVAPGPVPTENFDECMGTDTDEKRDKLLEMIGIPLGRYGTPEDIAAAVIYMASPAASWVTGQCLFVTGGR